MSEPTDKRVMKAIVEAVRKEALGPSASTTTTAYPLSAQAGENERDDWYRQRGRDAEAVRKKQGPVVTVRNGRDWAASVIVSPTGKNLMIVVPAHANVVVLADD